MKSQRLTKFLVGFITCMSFVAVTLSTLRAAEDGKGFYLLGSNASMAGAMPPPGTTLVNYDYYYRGDASGRAATGVLLDQSGARLDLQADVDLDANIYIKVPGALWVAPKKVLGGGFGVGVLAPSVGRTSLPILTSSRRSPCLMVAHSTPVTGSASMMTHSTSGTPC